MQSLTGHGSRYSRISIAGFTGHCFALIDLIIDYFYHLVFVLLAGSVVGSGTGA